MNDTLIILLTAFIMFIVFAIPFIKARKKRDQHTHDADLNALKYGLKEPVSLHPVVDLGACIGSGGCVEACPEKDVLGLQSGQAITISPARCIGHGLCERSCPVNAITLVFGSEKRGVDIPRIKGNFETNVDGIYIVGELGGMGLIKNAFEQGKQCIELIQKEKKSTENTSLDVLIIGCGPAGLSAAITAKNLGMHFKVVEREDIGGTVRYYPRRKIVMTHPLQIPGYGKLHKRSMLKEELIELWGELVSHYKLEINTNENVESVVKTDEVFEVKTNSNSYSTQRIILAIGRRGTPRKLGIPGEDLPNVSYSLREPDYFQNLSISVIGGGDSAVEAAMALADQEGNTVRIIYRGSAFSRIKQENFDLLAGYISSNKIELFFNSVPVSNSENSFTFTKEGVEQTVSHDYLFIFAGGILPTTFLNDMGIEIETKFGTPK